MQESVACLHSDCFTFFSCLPPFIVVIYDDMDFSVVCDKVKMILHAAGIHATTVQPEFVPRRTILLDDESGKVCVQCNRCLSVCFHLLLLPSSTDVEPWSTVCLCIKHSFDSGTPRLVQRTHMQ